MNDVVRRPFETLGRWLFATHFVILVGLAVCWAGLGNVDRADWALVTIALVVGSLYLAIASFVAAAVFRVRDSRMAFRFFSVAALAAISGMAGPLVSALLWRP